MVFALELCEPSDMQNAFRLVFETFGHVQSYIDAVFPAHWTPIGRKQGGERLLHDLTSDPTVRFLKATDTETGNLAGLSKWYIYEKDPIEDELEGDYWESDDSKAYAMHLYKEYYSNRRRVIRSSEKPILTLDMMTIHPDYQHHGAGTQIMKWSTELAERLGAQVNLDNARSARMITAYTESRQMTVEASEAGRHLYEEHGFRVTETIELSVPEKWAEKPKVRFDFMKRPANGTSSWKSIDQVKVL